jgi:serine/threonine protein kinase
MTGRETLRGYVSTHLTSRTSASKGAAQNSAMAELKLQQSRLDGRYDILECLGRGSYAEIYVARDNAAPDGAPETIVIKALNTFLQETPDLDLEHTLVANFQNEAVALDRVRHPNIINRLGHGTAIDLAGTTFHYLVLEYLPGGDMLALSRNHPLTIDKTLYYLEQVCAGLAHAHRCGVIHRDIKPQNLLLTADHKTVKIADFGVARLEATEGAITRVGTNIYSAPEHNPLVQTAALDTGSLGGRQPLTPSADVYSLAKTAYSLLAGESPRRFAQHAITDFPQSISGHYWATPVLRVLEKATQSRPPNRYQSVEEFWDDLSEAALRPTELLSPQQLEARRRPSEDLDVDKQNFTEVPPPQARFEPTESTPRPNQNVPVAGRPRIVVPVSTLPAMSERQRAKLERKRAADNVRSMPNRRADVNLPVNKSSGAPPRSRRLLVATALILAFSGMLLATHKYVTSHWNPLIEIPRVGDLFVVGREGMTTTDVNLRPEASTSNAPIGLAENGSRVKILSTNTNWYEVQVVEHGRPKADAFSSDRGWINKKFVKFD